MPEVQYHARVSISGWDVTVLILYHIDTIGCQYLENDISFIALHTFSLVNRINRVNVLYNCQCKTFHKLRSFFVTLTSLLQLLMINSKVQPLDVKTLAYEMKKYNCKCYEAAFFSYRQYFFFFQEFAVHSVDGYVPPEFVSEEGYYFSNPVKHRIDGSFAARLAKSSSYTC